MAEIHTGNYPEVIATAVLIMESGVMWRRSGGEASGYDVDTDIFKNLKNIRISAAKQEKILELFINYSSASQIASWYIQSISRWHSWALHSSSQPMHGTSSSPARILQGSTGLRVAFRI
jgi:hypothetical protein